MVRSHTAAVLAALLIAALSPAAAQQTTSILVAPGPAAAANTPDLAPEPVSSAPVASPAAAPAKATARPTTITAAAAPATDIATTSTVGSGSSAVTATGVAPSSSQLAGGEAPNNRTVGTQLVVPPGGCLIVSVTSAMDLCLQDASFAVNNQSIAIPADYRAAGIANSNTFFNNSDYKANNAGCRAAGASVTQIYETRGCVLASAATSTVGAAVATDIRNSFVCTSSGTDTTNYARVFGATAQEKRLCSVAIQDAQKSIAAGNGDSQSGDPCTAARATFIIPNPCPTYNTTVNTTGRFFLAPDIVAPPPMLEPLAAPEAAPGAAPGAAPLLAPDTAPAAAPGFAPAPAPGPTGSGGSLTAGDLAPATAPAPAPQSASRTAAFSAAAVALAACAALA